MNLEVPVGKKTETQSFQSAPVLTRAGRLSFNAKGRTITLEPLDADRLLARRQERGRPEQTEVWLRGKTPTLRARSKPRTLPSGAPLAFPLVVGGRPQTVVVEIRPASDPKRHRRYAKLEGLVHYEERTLPVGSTRITWSGKDRSFNERPLLPGRYLLTVRSTGSILTKAGDPPITIPLTITPLVARAKQPGPIHPGLDWPELTNPSVGWPLSGDDPQAKRAPAGALRGLARRARKRPRPARKRSRRRVRLGRIPVQAAKR